MEIILKVLLICHNDATLSRYGIARWLASFSNLVGIIELKEKNSCIYKRIQSEIKRVGIIRFVDVVAFRLYYRFFLSKKDRCWERKKLQELFTVFHEIHDTPILETDSPNSKASKAFIRELNPDAIIARCKTLIKKEIFSLPSKGTYVMHPGICPEYRNAHGCFWALVNNDLNNVGMTLLKIDEGIDTGPVYGHYTYEFDAIKESHIMIQHKVVIENLDAIKTVLLSIYNGNAKPISTAGRKSKSWGQPWLSTYLKWKYRAKRRLG